MQMAREDASEGTIVVAREQTAGRGRHGRSWLSPEGGLYLSAVLCPEIPIEQVWQIGFVISLAAAEAIADVSGLSARVKWPNDVLIDGRKVCGILIESGRRGDGAMGGLVVCGIGINVEARAFPDDLASRVTSICAETERNLSAFDVEDALLDALGRRYAEYQAGGFTPIMAAWKRLDCTSGREVEVHVPEGIVRGTAVEVDPGGSLVVKTPNGELIHITAGDVLL